MLLVTRPSSQVLNGLTDREENGKGKGGADGLVRCQLAVSVLSEHKIKLKW